MTNFGFLAMGNIGKGEKGVKGRQGSYGVGFGIYSFVVRQSGTVVGS